MNAEELKKFIRRYMIRLSFMINAPKSKLIDIVRLLEEVDEKYAEELSQIIRNLETFQHKISR